MKSYGPRVCYRYFSKLVPFLWLYLIRGLWISSCQSRSVAGFVLGFSYFCRSFSLIPEQSLQTFNRGASAWEIYPSFQSSSRACFSQPDMAKCKAPHGRPYWGLYLSKSQITLSNNIELKSMQEANTMHHFYKLWALPPSVLLSYLFSPRWLSANYRCNLVFLTYYNCDRFAISSQCRQQMSQRAHKIRPFRANRHTSMSAPSQVHFASRLRHRRRSDPIIPDTKAVSALKIH